MDEERLSTLHKLRALEVRVHIKAPSGGHRQGKFSLTQVGDLAELKVMGKEGPQAGTPDPGSSAQPCPLPTSPRCPERGV